MKLQASSPASWALHGRALSSSAVLIALASLPLHTGSCDAPQQARWLWIPSGHQCGLVRRPLRACTQTC